MDDNVFSCHGDTPLGLLYLYSECSPCRFQLAPLVNSNTGLLAFFNRYNFTISDDTPMEQDVAVDPEMLGKVFENMLEEEDRGQSGSFYTPRTIVSYMCQEALAGYLEESAHVPREQVRHLFDPDSDISLTSEQAQQVSDALDTLTVLDPAVGSGSFLIGMLNEIITLRKVCHAVLHGEPLILHATIAQWKEAIIRDTLYGVDIKPGAIEIAQLRLWLSLIVNQTMAEARPLPNLDYKLRAGNSLIETIDGEPILSESAQQMLNSAAKPQQPKLFDMSGAGDEASKLEDLRDQYFDASPEERKQLSADIRFQERRIIEAGLSDMLENTGQRIRLIERKYQTVETSGWKTADAKKYTELLTKEDRLQSIKRDLWDDEATLPFFLYRLHFNDVFAKKKGFDISIGNPPYVRIQTLDNYEAEQIKLGYESASGNFDLYVPFVEKSLQLTNTTGFVSYILPHKFFNAKYGADLRNIVSRSKYLDSIVHFGHQQIFEGATTYTCILILGKTPTDSFDFFLVEDILAWMEHRQANKIEITAPKATKDVWLFTASASSMFRKLKEHQTKLENITTRIFQGLKTGADKVYIVEELERVGNQIRIFSKATKQEYWIEDDLLFHLIKGGDSQSFSMSASDLLILFPYRIGQLISIDSIEKDYPLTQSYLLDCKFDLEQRENGKFAVKEWHQFSRNQALDVIQQPKIFTPDIAPAPRYSLDENGSVFFTGGTAGGYGIIPNEDIDIKYLLGLLNSRTLQYYLQHISTPMRGGWYSYEAKYIKNLPIPDAPDDLRQQIANLAQQCLDAAKDNPDVLPTLEAELNQLVYQAYGLDEDDIRVIEGHLAG